MQANSLDQAVLKRVIIMGDLYGDTDLGCPIGLGLHSQVDDIGAHFIKNTGDAAEKTWDIMKDETKRNNLSLPRCLPVCRQHPSGIHSIHTPAITAMDHAFPASTEHGDDVIWESGCTTLSYLVRDFFCTSDDDLHGSHRCPLSRSYS